MNPRTSKQAALEGARSVKGYPQSRILLLLSSSGRWPPHTRRRSVEASPWERDRTEQDDPPTSLASVVVPPRSWCCPFEQGCPGEPGRAREDLTGLELPRTTPRTDFERAVRPARLQVSCSYPLYYEEETGKSTKSEQLDKTASMRRAAELIVCLLASI